MVGRLSSADFIVLFLENRRCGETALCFLFRSTSDGVMGDGEGDTVCFGVLTVCTLCGLEVADCIDLVDFADCRDGPDIFKSFASRKDGWYSEGTLRRIA